MIQRTGLYMEFLDHPADQVSILCGLWWRLCAEMAISGSIGQQQEKEFAHGDRALRRMKILNFTYT